MMRTSMQGKTTMPVATASILALIASMAAIDVDCWSYQRLLSRFRFNSRHQQVQPSLVGFASTFRLARTKLSQESSTRPISDVSVYNCPELYDLAFGYRDFESEVEFLLKVHRLAQDERNGGPSSSRSPVSVLELAAGPAQHAIEAISNPTFGVPHAAALDSSPAMASYANRLLKEEFEFEDDDSSGDDKNGDIKSRLDYVVSDMRSFALERSYDTAWILLGSLQHLLTTDDVIRCFDCVYKTLNPGGTLIVELPHPQEVLGVMECTKNTWTVPLDGSGDDQERTEKLVIVWGDEDDPLDPITQVKDFTVEFQLRGCAESDWRRLGMDSSTLHQVVPMRLFTAGEMEALARCSGFRVAAMYGALEPEVLVDMGNEELAFRMICVLQKTG